MAGRVGNATILKKIKFFISSTSKVVEVFRRNQAEMQRIRDSNAAI